MLPVATATSLTAVETAAPGDAWALGGQDVYHRESGEFVLVDTGVVGQKSAVFALGRTDVWVSVASPNRLIHWDGTAWTSHDAGGSGTVTALWGASPNDLWGAAGYEALVHWNGQQWSGETHTGWNAVVRGIHGASGAV